MQLKYHMVTIEDLVPQEHFLRKLEAALKLSFVYEETTHLYSRRYGRPPIDPVVIVKYLLVGFLYGIPSERQIEQSIQTDVALRWYLGIDLDERVPDLSTISQLRRKPAFRKVFRRLFEEVVRQCVASGLVSGRLVVTDSTHVKANASRALEQEIDVEEEAENYWEQLDAYEEEGLEELKRQIPPMTSLWPIRCWRNLALTFLSCPSPPMTAQKPSLSGMHSLMRSSGMYTCVPTGKSCSANGCIEAGAGCFWNTGRTRKIAAVVLCGKSA